MRSVARTFLVWLLPAVLMMAALTRPSAIAWLFGAHEVTAAQLARSLAAPVPPLVLDVRTEAEYRAGHVAGAVWVPLGQLGGYLAAHPVSADREIVTVCAHGKRSAVGAAEVATSGHPRVVSLAGGTAAWRALSLPIELGLQGPPVGRTMTVPTTWLEQLVTVMTAFVIKPIYMLLALGIGLLLWRQQELDLSLLRRGMLLFFLGESACALRFLGVGPCDALELLHGLGMVAMGALFTWGLLELCDRRVLGYSDPTRTCVLGRFCQRCWKRDEVICGVHRIMRFMLPVLAVLCLLPLTAMPAPRVVEYDVFGTLVRDESTPIVELAQMRIYPLFGLWLFAVAFVELGRGQSGLDRAKAPFFGGVGFLSYTLLRFFLQHGFGQAVFWANAWEEVTELATVLTLIWILWTFKLQLGVGWRLRPARLEVPSSPATSA